MNQQIEKLEHELSLARLADRLGFGNPLAMARTERELRLAEEEYAERALADLAIPCAPKAKEPPTDNRWHLVALGAEETLVRKGVARDEGIGIERDL